MRAAIGDVVASGGALLALELLEECRSIVAGEGFTLRSEFLERTRRTVTAARSPFTASMLRDMERRARIEADHILGDLLRRGSHVPNADRSLLQLAYRHLKAYDFFFFNENAAPENPPSSQPRPFSF